MYMSLVNQNKSSEVICTAESLELCRVRTRTCTNQYGVLHFRNKEDTRKRSLCLYFLYFLLFSFFLTYFFSKVSNVKDIFAFYQLSHKLNCVFV